MSALPLDAAANTDLDAGRPSRPGRRLPYFLRRPGGLFGAVWLAFVVLASLTAPWWIPYGVAEQDLSNRLALPSADHWLGTDPLGRDLLSRIFSAGAEPLLGAGITVLVAFGIGLTMALIAAERGPRVERVSSRLAEVLLALPSTILLLAVIGAIGVRIFIVMAVLGVMISAAVYRVMLGVAKSVRQRLYVDAARVNGLSSLRVNLVHVLPSMGTVVAVQAAQLYGISLLIVAGLAFLGFGPAEPQPSWGFMIQDASSYVFSNPWLLVPTGVVLALTVVAANELADAIASRGSVARTTVRRRRPPARVGATATAGARPADPGAVLDVRDLHISVDDGPALVTGVSFALQPGRVLGLVGESGCGKTMTARSLMGLLPDGVSVSGGSIRWQGRELVGLSQEDLSAVRGREIAMISQEPMVALDPMFSVVYQLTQPIRRFRGVGRREARQIAAQLLRQVGIVDGERVLKSYPHQLSGGMAQRVCIALALTGEPRLLIADEPTTALDVTVQAEILSLLRALVRDTGLSVVIVSHDLGVVADICDDVAVMYAGTVVEDGTAAAVLDEPAHPYTQALLAANPHVADGEPVPTRLASIDGTVPPPGEWPTGCRFASRCLFAQEQCTQPFPSVPAHGSGSVLCTRVEELSRADVTWTSAPTTGPAGHETAPAATQPAPTVGVSR
ncbi:dipeptide/oligopeptide/nickel ABC transporter permease/ATP-binding protein [Modestobacter sp. VKM Ac-2985]|uniref:dipeptide/oligopeptide/nickel ABC transporter permease/ATP-binding protein n=1 Tax=Modestobacter sp. VKM Ac-2985 TaxID=3004139 RepID=UPI0022AB9205|nr:dipeptide/oligopeptide/nickel ABC transporter permease/ATP-binding protein [Modestobacter sp. VKM Ac-2985]MCZ2839392.1 dipeptide/oligopeptide/nickel ABC transporter permease/ATP-binding protein [Modestobacter sp. VKM Ac-2985]